MKFARRTQWVHEPNALSRAADRLRARGQRIIDMTESNPTRCGLGPEGSDWLRELAHPKNKFYEPSPQGLRSAREAIAGYYAKKNIQTDPSDIFLCSSTSEAYAFLFRLLADPGDSVAAPKPSYPLFDFLSGLSDLRLEKYALEYKNHWQINHGDLIQKSKGARAILCVNPNNPTGHFVSIEEKKFLVEAALRENAAIIADEVFHDFIFNPDTKPLSLAGESQSLVFTLSGISKILGFPQMKLSWIVVSGPKDLKAEASQKLEIISDTYLSVNTPAQNALPYWLSQQESAAKKIIARVLDNRRELENRLRGNRPFELLKADGGWYAVLGLKKPARSDEEIAVRLIEEKGVLVHPGYFYDFEENGYFVLSLLVEPQLFSEGLDYLTQEINQG